MKRHLQQIAAILIFIEKEIKNSVVIVEVIK